MGRIKARPTASYLLEGSSQEGGDFCHYLLDHQKYKIKQNKNRFIDSWIHSWIISSWFENFFTLVINTKTTSFFCKYFFNKIKKPTILKTWNLTIIKINFLRFFVSLFFCDSLLNGKLFLPPYASWFEVYLGLGIFHVSIVYTKCSKYENIFNYKIKMSF